MIESTALAEFAAETENGYFYLLLEGGTQETQAFEAFYTLNASEMYSLYLHPQLAEFKNYGPWLQAVKNNNELTQKIKDTPGVVGVIATKSCLSGALAAQLSYACTVIGPDDTTALIRFYTRQVISLLAQCGEQEWHTFLFRNITRWWAPLEGGWQPVPLLASTAENPRDHAVRINEEIWQQIMDEPEVGAILTQWQKMPASQHFPPCSQRDMVIKALEKARLAGMPAGVDSKLYALYYLNGGKKILESEGMQVSLGKVSQGEVSLKEILSNALASKWQS